ncbi:MAG: peptidylprolyl isomerase [Bacteroidota bacterium]|jgi:peptidyl-prolyl cis-trans isomerase SurA
MYKKRIKLAVSIFLLTLFSVSAQNKNGDQVILKIDGKPITKAEFEAVFFKNNPSKEVKDQKSVEEYMDMFINFKLKVKNAEELGMDTMRNFLNELNGYRKQLASPYLTDKNVNEQLVKEAYERLKIEIHASHILVKISEDALPKDTLEAYNKIMNYRNRAVKGEDFGKIARETAEKGDPSAKENKGDLGFFTAFAMIYPFETAAYNTKVGEVSMPVRTAYGYHIIKVWEKRSASGELLLSHIVLRNKKDATKADSSNVKKKIDEIYSKIKEGANWDDLCAQFSEDKSTANKGGQLPSWVSRGKLPLVEFENAAFNLKENGQISEPFQTSYGWHIVKRIDKKDLAPFEKMRNELKQKVEKGQRGQVGRASLIAKIKSENGFSEFTTKTKKLVSFPALDELISKLDTTYWDGKWSSEKVKGFNKPLFKIGETTYNQYDFAKYLEQRQTKRPKNDFKSVANTQYNNWVNDRCIALEESMLDKKYPEFKALMQEYRDGILLFDLLDKKVWTKAMKDTLGLKGYYEQNKNNYLWDERADVNIYKCADEKIANQVKSMASKKKSDKEITEKINKSSQLNVSIDNIMYIKNERKLIDDNWKEGVFGPFKDETSEGKFCILKINKVLPKQPKQLNEAKGAITTDYQNYLEKEWIKELRSKHKFDVNKEVLQTVGK